MKKGFYNSKKAEQEEKIKKEKKIEEEKRTLYFSQLKKDKYFQEYVVGGIIKRNIESLTDTRKLKIDGKGKEQLADIVIANIKASATLQNIFNELLR